MKRSLLALGVVVALVLPIMFMGALIAIAEEDLVPSQRALAEIPGDLLPLYRAAAATCPGLDWTILAAIHKIETNFGRGRAVSSMGAQGPMQFMPATWTAYATDGDNDGSAFINDVDDAVFSAAALLCANGAGDQARLADAIWNYNHSDEYVARVLELAASYGVVILGSKVHTSRALILDNPRILLTANARADVEAGIVDPRVLLVLEAVSRRYSIGVTVFKTGHAMRTRSGSISNHYYGRAVDIFFVGGQPVSSGNASARELILLLKSLSAEARPSEVGHPFANLDVPGGFTDADHDDHLHVGFD